MPVEPGGERTAVGLRDSRPLKSHSAASGTASQVIAKEKRSPEAMVKDRALKKAPVTRLRKASGTKITTVAGTGARKRLRKLGRGGEHAGGVFPGPARRRRTICSIMTMASSMMSPTAAAMPPRVMMLNPMPSA